MLNRLFAAAIAAPFAILAAPLGAIAQIPTNRSTIPLPTLTQTDLSGASNPQIEIYRRPASLGRTNTRRSEFNNRFGTTRSQTRQFRTPFNQLFSTFCTYSPSFGEPNPLGQRAFITATEVAGTTIFRYEAFSAVTSSPQSFDPSFDPSFDLRQFNTQNYPSVADVASNRSITFYDTPLQLARRQLANSPTQYAELLGLSATDPLVRRGYGSVDRLLACQEVGSSSIASISEITDRRFGTPFAINREIDTPSRSIDFSITTAAVPVAAGPIPVVETIRTVAELPDGNYRFASSITPNSGGGFINGSAIASGDRVFTFRKSGVSVVGDFAYLDSGESACISGVVQGDTIVGEALVTSGAATDVLGRTYLGPGLSLQLPADSEAVLSLGGFELINAGDIAPPKNCG